MKMNLAVIGSGGREHAIAWKLQQSPRTGNIFVVPGNGGTANNVKIPADDFGAIRAFCERESIDLLFIGPEDPLANGIVDYMTKHGIRVLGPDRQAACLESSKIWAKEFMKRNGVSTASFHIFGEGDDPSEIIRRWKGDLVVKYDGLAAGKGVIVCSSEAEATTAVKTLRETHGHDARLIIEEKVAGREISVIGFTDGKTIRLLLPSQDHKPVGDGDRGPNTGGMGAYCPVPFCDKALMRKIDANIVQPTLQGIRSEQLNYRGILYFGLMIREDQPYLLEYNVRFGDPETEVILPALKNDLAEVMQACENGTLAGVEMDFKPGFYVDVVLASGGYPGSYEKGNEIRGLEQLDPDTLVFHAGTKKENGGIVTSGGRVLNVVCHGQTLQEAIDRVYTECSKIRFKNKYYRSDIGKKGLV